MTNIDIVTCIIGFVLQVRGNIAKNTEVMAWGRLSLEAMRCNDVRFLTKRKCIDGGRITRMHLFIAEFMTDTDVE